MHNGLSDKLYINTTIGHVKSKNQTEVFRFNPYINFVQQEAHSARFNRQDFRFSSYLNIKFNANNNLRMGVNLAAINYDYYYNSFYQYERIYPFKKYDEILVIPFMDRNGWCNSNQYYIQHKHKFSDKVSMNLGVNAFYFDLTNSSSIDPRFNLNYKHSNKTKWFIAAGRHSKHEDFSTLFIMREGEENYIDLDLVKSNHLVVGNEYKLNKDWLIRTEAYFQYMYDIGVDKKNHYPFSNFNMFELYSLDIHDSIVDLSSEGKAKTRGLEISLEKYFSDHYYCQANFAFTRSFFSDIDGDYYASAFDHKHIMKIAVGKEWLFGDNDQKTFGLNIGFKFAQGKRYLKLDEEKSKALGFQTYDYEAGYSEVGPNIFNVDLGINYIVNNQKVTHEIRLDIFNVNNQEPVIGTSFDRLQNKEITYSFYGLVPFFVYAVKW